MVFFKLHCIRLRLIKHILLDLDSRDCCSRSRKCPGIGLLNNFLNDADVAVCGLCTWLAWLQESTQKAIEIVQMNQKTEEWVKYEKVCKFGNILGLADTGTRDKGSGRPWVVHGFSFLFLLFCTGGWTEKLCIKLHPQSFSYCLVRDRLSFLNFPGWLHGRSPCPSSAALRDCRCVHHTWGGLHSCGTLYCFFFSSSCFVFQLMSIWIMFLTVCPLWSTICMCWAVSQMELTKYLLSEKEEVGYRGRLW